MAAPLAIDLFCGLGGWTEGLLAEGWGVIGFDIERHVYGDVRYPAQLVLQDVLTLHGSQFRDAALIVASPPCQAFSYMAMPWSKAKEKQRHIEADPAARKRLTTLFDACFRIQREAIQAAGRFVPLVVENVRGAQKWVGRARWNYGSFYLWGDVPALMPITLPRQVMKQGIAHRPDGVTNFHGHKNNGGSWFNIGSPGQKVLNQNPVHDYVKIGGDWFSDSQSTCRRHSSKSNARKAASAAIAKIPLPLARHVARCWLPPAALAVVLLVAGCGTESADSAQVAAATPTAVVQPADLGEPGHTQMSDEYTVAKSPDEVCVVSLRSDCAPWGAWATAPPTPAVPWRDNRTPVAAVAPCGGGA